MKKKINHFYPGLILTAIFAAALGSYSAASNMLLKPPGLRPISDPATVIPATNHYSNQKLQLPRYRSAPGAPLGGWSKQFIKTRRFSSDQSAWIYYRQSDLKRTKVIKLAGFPDTMRIWPVGATLILEGYKEDVRSINGQNLTEIEVMSKMDFRDSTAADAYFPVNWSYARFNPQGARALTAEKLNECHQCHSIAFRLTGDLIFTAFP